MANQIDCFIDPADVVCESDEYKVITPPKNPGQPDIITCNACGGNCIDCEDQTGICIECKEDHAVSDNGKYCSRKPTDDCPFPYGQVDGDQQCDLKSRYSEKRLIPSYADDADFVDWRDWGIINPVRDQKKCGSCWAFTTIAMLEPWYAIKHGPLYKFSEQHLIDCDTSNGQCYGGTTDKALNFIKDQGAIKLEEYPFNAAVKKKAPPAPC